jgi:hypothetical protein
MAEVSAMIFERAYGMLGNPGARGLHCLAGR